ncbi:hypothetical protein AB182_27930 [Phytobacter ursingii]|uniref:Uncharacterized protein n=1 Tax=Phytobacter ursingii TaxID=1972431 RepID=A0AAC8QU39_9ENTR|nr:hypothetical protein AB182_27930 [Phytobacter ursingii]
MEGFAKSRPSLDQVPGLALRTSDRSVIGFIYLLGMFTLRIVAAANEHPEPPLSQYQYGTTNGAVLSFQNFDDMPIRLTFQRTDVIAFRIVRTSEKRTMLAGTNNEFSPALWAGLVVTHRKQC